LPRMSVHPFKQWRLASGKTLADVSAATGAHTGQLSDIERWRKRPSLKLAVRLSRATDGAVPVETFAEAAPAEAAE
jgi:transcriptional regulator with XRE-family HTH domain